MYRFPTVFTTVLLAGSSAEFVISVRPEAANKDNSSKHTSNEIEDDDNNEAYGTEKYINSRLRKLEGILNN